MSARTDDLLQQGLAEDQVEIPLTEEAKVFLSEALGKAGAAGVLKAELKAEMQAKGLWPSDKMKAATLVRTARGRNMPGGDEDRWVHKEFFEVEKTPTPEVPVPPAPTLAQPDQDVTSKEFAEVLVKIDRLERESDTLRSFNDQHAHRIGALEQEILLLAEKLEDLEGAHTGLVEWVEKLIPRVVALEEPEVQFSEPRQIVINIR